MMKRTLIFALALALFIAITGGYGQLVNSRWVTRSFISAEEKAEAYPPLQVGKRYLFWDTQEEKNATVVEIYGQWVLVDDNYRTHYINLDRISRITLVIY